MVNSPDNIEDAISSIFPMFAEVTVCPNVPPDVNRDGLD